VLDADTQKPISDVNIFIPNQNIGTVTDDSGNFDLLLENYYLEDNLESQINLRVQIIGYEEKTILVSLLKERNDLGEILLISLRDLLASVSFPINSPFVVALWVLCNTNQIITRLGWYYIHHCSRQK